MANEKRLIDANDALERLKKAEKEMKVVSLCGCKAVPMDGVIDFVASRPTVYAVEVVRCKDCKHYDKTHLNNGDRRMCTKFLGLTIPRPDDFCSYGERRTDD